MNQIRVIGMKDAESEITKQSSPSDFGDDLYDGVSLYRRKDMKPVVPFVSKNAEPARWKVLDGASNFTSAHIQKLQTSAKCADTSS